MTTHLIKNEQGGSRLVRSLRLTWFFIRPYGGRLILAAALIISAAISEYFSIALLFNAVNALSGSPVGSEGLQGLFRILQSLVMAVPASSLLVASAIALLIAFLLRASFSFAANYEIERLAQKIRMDLQSDLLSRYLAADCAFFSDARQGNLLYNTLQAPATVAAMISLLAQTVMAVMTAVFLIGLLFSISVKITAVLFSVAVVAAGVVAWVSRRVAYVEGQRANKSLSRLNVIANEAFTCIKVVKSYIIQGRVEEEFRGQSDEFYAAKLRLVIYRHLVTEVFATGIVVLFVGFIVRQAMSGVSSFITFLPSLSVYLISLLRLASILSDLGKRVLDYANNLPNMDLLHRELTSPHTQPDDPGRLPIASMGSIEFQHVTFGYGDKKVLDDVSFTIKKNQMVALVGPSGGGKTSILSLLLKLYRPQAGIITIDGVDLNGIGTASLLHLAAPVFQTPLLFNQSVAENVALEKRADIDMAKLADALAKAHAAEFVSDLPSGVDTEIGDLGDRLSVGQKQRLLIARAFYKEPQLILFDEPTSALDATSEKLIVQTIRELSGSKTMVVVAHRLSTIEHADQILVLKDGRIVESGRHDELLKRQGEYAAMYGEARASNKEKVTQA